MHFSGTVRIFLGSGDSLCGPHNVIGLFEQLGYSQRQQYKFVCVCVCALLIGSCIFMHNEQGTPLGNDSNVQGHLQCFQPGII